MRAEGTLVGIARRDQRRAPMECVERGFISLREGLVGDHKGPKFPERAITVLAEEDWAAALSDLSTPYRRLEWWHRRANLLIRGLRLPRAIGAELQIGEAHLRVTRPTTPCRRMDEVAPGLLKALTPNWRGGLTCKVVGGGQIALGDSVILLTSPVERQRRLPG